MRRFLVDLALLKKQFQVPALQTYLSRANLNMVGPTITYYTLLSLVPVLMSVGAIAGLVGINAQELNSMLREQLPKNIMSILGPIITSVLSGGVGILSFSIVITIWGASSVLAVIRKAFNAVHDVPERVSGMLTRVFSFLWLMVILLTAGVLMGASAMMPAIINSVFMDPPLARVGLSEMEARKKGLNIKVNTLPVAAIPRARTLGETDGLFKVVVDADTNKILGCSLFGPETSEIINIVSIVMKTGQEYTFLRDYIFTHPSMSEALNDLMNF